MTCGGHRRFIVGLHSNRRQASSDSNSNNHHNDPSSPSSTSSNTSSLLASLFSSASSCSSFSSSSSSSSSSSISTSSSSPPVAPYHRQPQHLSRGGTPTTTTGTSSHRITTQGTNCHQSGCGDPDNGRKGQNRHQKETVCGCKCPHNNQKRRTSINNNTSTSATLNNHCGSLDSSSVTNSTTTRATSGSCSRERGRTGCTSPALSTSCWKPLSIMARKRDDKSPARNCGDRQERKMESYLADDENYPSFSNQVVKLGLQLRDIPADG